MMRLVFGFGRLELDFTHQPAQLSTVTMRDLDSGRAQ